VPIRHTGNGPIFLNRSAIVLEPRRPYIEWANSLDDGPRYDEVFDEPDAFPVFLGPDQEQIEKVHRFVAKHYNYFFDEWLSQWCTDAALWPRDRTWKMFRLWFKVRIHSVVIDSLDAPLEVD
jgi:hypothetical protein